MDEGIINAVWNRALVGQVRSEYAGDRALAAMLRAHGRVMNGGVFHCIEIMESVDLETALAGYCYFGLERIAALLMRGQREMSAGVDFGGMERIVDAEYAHEASDSILRSMFERRFGSNRSDFAEV